MIELNNISYQYDDGTKALKSISLAVFDGESVALVGANGAGKSTLLLHLNGCLLPRQGTISVNGQQVDKQTLNHVRVHVGMVFQDPDDMLFMPSVREDVAFGPLNHGIPVEQANRMAEFALEKVGISHLADRPHFHLSAGEKRAAAIAAALASDPAVLVMDEPSVNLDPKARRQLINTLAAFKRTKIIATHDLDMALDLCTRTIILNQGQILAEGPSSEIFQNSELLEKAHLEKPLCLQSCPLCGNRKNR